jgi:hypothetical protein
MPRFTMTFTVEIAADTEEEATETYEALIANAIDISNSSATAEVCVMAPADQPVGAGDEEAGIPPDR